MNPARVARAFSRRLAPRSFALPVVAGALAALGAFAALDVPAAHELVAASDGRGDARARSDASDAPRAPGALAPLGGSEGEPVTRAIEKRPPARPLSEASRADVDALSPAELDRLAGESRERWRASGHGPMLARILPRRLEPSQLPEPQSRGARLTALYCVQCHHLPRPAMHDARRWPEIVRRMVPRMEGRGNLGPLMADMMRGPDQRSRALAAPTSDEEREIVAYLQRHAQRGLDRSARPEVAGALEHGAGRMFGRACSQCHVLPDPTRHSAEEWPAVVQRMQENMLWMNRVSAEHQAEHRAEHPAGRPDSREPKLFPGEIVRFLQRHARR